MTMMPETSTTPGKPMSDFHAFFIQFQDYLAPTLDVYEQAVYLYIARRTAAESQPEVVIGFKSVKKKMAFGVGAVGTRIAEGTMYEKLRSLESKGVIKILSSERTGTRVRLIPPQDIPGLIPAIQPETKLTLEQLDFFSVPENRQLILERERRRCFHCLVGLTDDNYVLDHVESRAKNGDNSYRNVVAACRRCNNRKNSESAEDFLRALYREGLLSAEDVASRHSQLGRLRADELKPVVQETGER